jgi:hypothetical protein
MTLGQTTAVAMAWVGALAIGIWMSPFILETGEMAPGTRVTAASRVDSRRAGSPPPAAPAPSMPTGATIAAVPVTAPELQARLKPLLTRGANMRVAAEGFENAEQFAAVVHAAHNTAIPFMLLKHRVLELGKSLDEAIRDSKPNANAEIEADRARAEARSVIASLRG